MPARDEEELLRLAESVTDGRPVNWDAESSTDESFRKRVNRLRILESIGAASGMPPATPRAPAGASSDPTTGVQPGSRSPVLDRWGHLEILELIGDGVFGVVHRAWETTLDREVAVKFLRPEPTPGLFAKHMLQEGRTMARVRHSNVIAVYGAEELGGRVGIWMEYVHGRTLEDILQEQGTFGAREAAMIGIDLCRALAAVHHAGLVHRDVKTKNVMREEGGRIVLMDFGTGIEARPDAAARTSISAGTPMYQAPEVLGGAPASPQSDLFSLGVLLFRLVTRSYPVEASRLEDLKAAYERQQVKLLRDVRPDLPAAFARAVERALATAPEGRFASAGQMEAALAATLAGPERLAGGLGTGDGVTAVAPMSAGRTSAPAAPGRAAPAAPWFRSRAAIAVGAIVVALGVLVVLWARTPPEASRGERMAVAVADIDNDTAERELDGLAGMFTTSLEQSHELSVLTRSRMGDILTQLGREKSNAIDEDLGREICKRSRVGALLVPSIRKFDDLYTIDLVVLDPLRDRYRFTVREQAQGRQRIPAMVDVLSARVYAELMARPAAAPIAAASVAAITTDDLDAYHHYYEAERHIDRLEMQAARQSLETAVSLDTTFGLAYCRLAYADWWASDFDKEREHLRKATSLIHRIPEKERYRLRAQVAMSERQGLEAARSILLEMARFYPDDKEMLYDIGDYSSHLSEYPVAVQYLEKAVEADPGFVRALLHLARCYRDMGRGPELLEWAQRYAAADTSWESSALLGDGQIATGNRDGGMRTLVAARSRYPDRALELTIPIARAHIARGDCDSAAAAWSRFFGGRHPLWSQRCAYEELGFLYAHQGRYREASAAMDRAIAVARQDGDPVGEPILHLNKALLSILGWNDWAAASREIEASAVEADRVTYAERYFEYWPYWGRHFKLRLLGGDLSGAETLAKQKFSMEKWYGPYVGAYLQGARGECVQAEASSSTMLTWGPAGESLELLYFLSRCQVEAGRYREAVASLRRLQDHYGPLNAGSVYYTKSLVLLGQTYENLGEAGLARKTYTELVSIWKQADADLPDLIEAKARLSRLRSPAAPE